MNAIEIVLDGDLFSVDVVARTAHRYTGDYFVEIVSTTPVMVRLKPKTDNINFHLLAERFRNDALDELLRERIRLETSELHTALVRAALTQATPLSTIPGQKQ